jgi:hypothetical protein
MLRGEKALESDPNQFIESYQGYIKVDNIFEF